MRALKQRPPNDAEPKVYSDAELVSGIAAREEWAAEVLYRRLLPIVHHSLRRILQYRVADLEDLVQVVFENIVRTIIHQRFSGNCSLSTWAALIATRVAIDALRSRVRERQFVLGGVFMAEGTVPETVSFERRIEARAEVARLQRVLAELPPKYSEALILHDVLGYPIAEMSLLLGVSATAAQSRLFRGRRQLLGRLQSSREEEGS